MEHDIYIMLENITQELYQTKAEIQQILEILGKAEIEKQEEDGDYERTIKE